MNGTQNRTDKNIMNLRTRDPETGKPQLINAILGTPDGPVVIGTGFKTLQEAWDAAVRWSGPEHVESEARELHKNDSRLNWLRWEQLTKPCQDEFRRDARIKLGVREAKTNA